MSSLRQELAAILIDYADEIPDFVYMEILRRLGEIPNHKDPKSAKELELQIAGLTKSNIELEGEMYIQIQANDDIEDALVEARGEIDNLVTECEHRDDELEDIIDYCGHLQDKCATMKEFMTKHKINRHQVPFYDSGELVCFYKTNDDTPPADCEDEPFDRMFELSEQPDGQMKWSEIEQSESGMSADEEVISDIPGVDIFDETLDEYYSRTRNDIRVNLKRLRKLNALNTKLMELDFKTNNRYAHQLLYDNNNYDIIMSSYNARHNNELYEIRKHYRRNILTGGRGAIGDDGMARTCRR